MLSDVVTTLRNYEPVLRARGVAHASVFGSVARGSNTESSDIDILLDFEEGRSVSIYDYAEIKEMISSLYHGRADVVTRAGLKKALRERVEQEAVNVF